MTKIDQYRGILTALDESEWEPYLLSESGLPGPRANLELVEAVADLGTPATFDRFLAFDPEIAPANSQHEYLALCGVVGLGRLLAEGQIGLLARIKQLANDPRWRMREGVRMALQRLGKKDMGLLMDEMERWSSGSLLERYAAAVSLCHPELLTEDAYARRALHLLDAMTTSVAAVEDRHSDEFKTLRKGLGFCWSIAVVALPEAGKPLMEKWLSSADKDVVWIIKQNLNKSRLCRMDAEWVEKCKAQL